MNELNGSGITYAASCEFSKHQLLSVQIQIDGPFNDDVLELAFPRWVPGSYFIREPIRFMQDILAINSNGNEVFVERFSHNRIRIKLPEDFDNNDTIRIRYKLLCTQLSVRNNHLDKSHLHLMPPFTWMEVTKGISKDRINSNHKIILAHPASWDSESQMPVVDFEIDPLTLEFIQEDLETTKWVPSGRDEFLDGIIESNGNKAILFKVNGCSHKLKLWDAGNHEIPENNVKELVEKMKLIISEHYALFGTPEWKEYLTILHLTDGARGGLEHLRSQTSMVPRLSLITDNIEEWRDLLSLFSHEFLHQWNVKRLRPVEFLDYDLNEEVHTDLLWWFEGLTSWLGDVLCWRSGAWSDADWVADMKRKLERHFTGNGNQHQCLSMASYEAWIHLYRPHSHSRESQISYYLEGELALFCIDAEFRKTTNGGFGLDDLMVLLWKKHGIDNSEGELQGLDWKRLCDGLRELGGDYMVEYVDTLVNKKIRPPIEDAADIYGVKVISDNKDKTKNLGWLGIVFGNNSLKIRNFQTDSPCRTSMKTGDELIAVDGLRVSDNKSLKKILTGRANTIGKITISSQGKLSDVTVKIGLEPEYPTLFKGEGNAFWKDMKKSRI
tara:strand:- start:217 stop:2049 length:1833 start_codon:yes stop_codon:yes gene_type:complete